MDGGISVNIINLETLDLLGIERAQLQPSAGGFHGVVPAKKALPVGRIDVPTTPSSDTRDTPSSWRSPTTPTSS